MRFVLVTVLILLEASVFTAFAQDWAVGKWSGKTQGSAGGFDQRELILKDDGSFISNIDSVRGGFVTHAGTCTVRDDTLRCTGTVKAGPPVILGQPVEYVLSKKGDDLAVTITSAAPAPGGVTRVTREAIFNRAK